MASSIETTDTTTTLKNNGNTYLSVDTNDDVAITNTLTATSPAFVTPNIGAATVTSLNGGQLGGNRNLVINGDMRIDQRNAGAAVTPTDGLYSADRWRCGLNQASKFSIQQQSEAPAGFSSSLKITSLSAYSLAVGDLFIFEQRIEGFNFSDLAWGTASAKAVTLSFYVRSSLTGTFGGSVRNAANARSYPFNYTISSADTWEQKTVTIAGDTSGTWVTTNAHSATVGFGLGVGTNFTASAGSWVGSAELSADSSVSVVGTNAATFYITGVQLEEGSVATPFEHRSYGEELALCQRYYQHSYPTGTAIGTANRNGCLQICSYSNSATGQNNGIGFRLDHSMRTAPTVVGWNPDEADTSGSGRWDAPSTGATTGNVTFSGISGSGVSSLHIVTSGRSTGAPIVILLHYTATAEL